MGLFIQTNELTGSTIPTDATGIKKDGWGIDATLSGFIIQSASVTASRSEDITQDQKGAQVGALDFDQRWDLTLDVIGTPASSSDIAKWEDGDIGIDVGDTNFFFNNHRWKVTGVTYTGSFQDKKRFSISAYRTVNFPGDLTVNRM